MPMMGIKVTISTILQKEKSRPPSIFTVAEVTGGSLARLGVVVNVTGRLSECLAAGSQWITGMRSHRERVDEAEPGRERPVRNKIYGLGQEIDVDGNEEAG